MPIEEVTCYELVCPVCGVEHCRDDEVPYFNSIVEAENYAIGSLDWSDGEPMDRAIARACRIEGCGEAAWDKKKGETVDKDKDESEVAKQKKLLDDKKRTVAYLKSRVEEHDRVMAQNFAKGSYALAARDAKGMMVALEMLSEIDLSS